MEIDKDLEKPKYKNWVRGAKGLVYLQEGLETFVGDHVKNHRDQTIQKITSALPHGSLTQCNLCTRENLLPDHAASGQCSKTTCKQKPYSSCYGSKQRGRRICPSGICSKLYDEIVESHQYRNPMWQNTDPSTWCSDPVGWSYAKCFQTTPNQGTCSSETDASGLLSIIINGKFFQNEVSHSLDIYPNVFDSARRIRNEIMHCAKMELEENELQHYIVTFIAVLIDQKRLLNDPVAIQSVEKLDKLKNNQITISLSEEINLIQVRKEALMTSEKLEKKEKDILENLENKKQVSLAEIEGAKSEMQVKKREALEDLEEAKSEMKDKKQEALGEIASAMSDMQVKKEVTLNELQKAETEASERIAALHEAVRKAEEAITQLTAKQQQMKKKPTIKLETSTAYCNVSEGDKGNFNEDPELRKMRTALDKARTELVKNMHPDKIIDAARQCGLFVYVEARDLKEVGNTSEKNRRITDSIRGKGIEGYKQFKGCLNETGQSQLVHVLEFFERGEEPPESLLKNLFEKTKQEETTSKTEDKENPYFQMKSRPGDAERRQKRGLVHRLLSFWSESKQKKDLRRDLIKFYRQQHYTIQLSPLIEEEDARLLDFYVKPDINLVELNKAHGSREEKKTPLENTCDVFYKDKGPCREIYVTADAGFGKTMFSKRLVLAWCHAKDPLKNDKRLLLSEEVNALKEFDFVFLVLLRDGSSECHIEDFIFNQLIDQRLENDYCRADLENILSKERCLIILDGLDEWAHPSNDCTRKEETIPHRRARENPSVLTTTRPWKLATSGIKASQIDQKLEIAGLGKESAKKLKKSVISHLGGKEDKIKVNQFDSEMKANKLLDLAYIPILLMYMLCLFFDKISLGNSLLGLYCNIVEMLLKRTVKKYKRTGIGLPHIPEYTQGDIPPCFRENKKCRKYYSLLNALGKLAYETLLTETKEENMLVFDRTVAKQYVKKEWLDFCLKTGLLTQSKDCGKLLEQKCKISFAHKTVQEFFAALYMFSAPDVTSVSKTVLSKCKSLRDIFEMSNILVFISGFNAEVSSLILHELMNIVNNDETTREYRSTVDDIDSTSEEPLKQYQDLCVSCLKEMPDKNKVSSCLQDVFIDDSCRQDQYREILQHLTSRSKRDIRSVYIDMYYVGEACYSSLSDVIDFFSLSALENVEKVDYNGHDNDRDILPLLNESIKCLHLSCDESFWSRLQMEKVKSLKKLEAIGIGLFPMIHSVLSELCNYISQTRRLKRIVLYDLDCTDHEDDCPGIKLDLSGHSGLRKLELWQIPVKELRVNMASLEECKLERLYTRELVLKFVNNEPTDSKLTRTVVWLRWVKMSAGTFRDLLNEITNLPQTVRVMMVDCTIEPKKEFERMKTEIRSSQQFNVLEDGRDWLWFETIKGGM